MDVRGKGVNAIKQFSRKRQDTKERHFEHVLQYAYCTQSRNRRQGSGNADEY